MKIGILGGTFDPVHIGHLIVAEDVRKKIGLDRIAFIPAAIPPHKTQWNITPGADRLAMVRIAIQGNPGFDASDVEISRGGISYTVDTLRQIQDSQPDDSLTLLIGQDNLLEFWTWKDPERILGLATVVVMSRPGFTPDNRQPLPKSMQLLEVPEIGIASREIRERVRNKLSIRYLVPDSVARYIEQHRLYGDLGPL